MRTMLELVSDSAAANLSTDSSGQAWYDHFTGLGDTVDVVGVSAIPTDLSGYDVIWVGNSVGTTQNLGSIISTSVPVIATGVRSPHPNYSTVAATLPGDTQNYVYLKAAGVGAPMVNPAWVEGNVTVLDTAFAQRYATNTRYGSGNHQVACKTGANLTYICWSYYDAGDLMASSVAAPSKRAWFMFHPGSIGSNANGWDAMERLVEWAAPSSSPALTTEAWLYDGSSLATSQKLDPLLWDGASLQAVNFDSVV